MLWYPDICVKKCFCIRWINIQPNFLLEWAKVNKHHWLGDRPISQYDLWTTYTYFICSLAISSVKIFGAFILKKKLFKVRLRLSRVQWYIFGYNPSCIGIQAREPICDKINQCHFGDFSLYVMSRPKCAPTFEAGQKKTSAMARWHWLDGRPVYRQ